MKPLLLLGFTPFYPTDAKGFGQSVSL